jgi:hypothetical protein
MHIIIFNPTALMSDSYERIQDQAALELQRVRAKLLLIEIDAFMSKEQLTDNTLFPDFIHVLIPKGSNETENKATQWLGVLGAIKSHTVEQNSIMRKEVDGLRLELAGIDDKISMVQSTMERHIEKVMKVEVQEVEERLKKQIGAVEAKLDAILHLLKRT